MKRLLIFLLFPFAVLANCTGSSPTWTTTPDQASVQTCINNATAGDTINITAGTGSVTWTIGNTLGGKPLSIIGPGQANLTITDSAPTNASPTCAAFLSTSITSLTQTTRISGFTIQPGLSTVCPIIFMQGTCTASGCPNLRVDHITFNGFATVTRNNNGFGINATADLFGVFDHNTFNGVTNNFLQVDEVSHASYLGVGFNGDNSWAQSENYGSQNFIVFENNTFNTSGCCENEAGLGFSNVGGSRVVVRFNTFNNMDALNEAFTWHGTESLQRRRGGRAFEFYANTFTCTPGVQCNDVNNARSGTGLTWGNSIITNQGFNKLFNFGTYRTESASQGWNTCDGTSPYDTNDTNGGGGNTAFVYFTGTVLSVSTSGGTSTVTATGSPGWIASQWVPNGAPYSMHDTTQVKGSEILSNNANSFTVLNTGVPGNWTPAVNDGFQITRALVCLDPGAGRGAGILYNNVDPATPTNPASEVLSPAYFWANAFGGGGFSGTYVNFFPPNGRNIRNRDWYQDNLNQTAQTNATSPFDGTTTIGAGWGTLARRPTTCTVGVTYWAADQGSWNTNSTSIPGTPGFTQGQLYTCTATNTWALKYTPLTYPHPLIGGVSVPTGSLSPTILTFVSQVVGTSSAVQTFTFTNNGPGTLTIGTITLTGDYSQTNNCPFSPPMQPNTSCTFNVIFTPTVAGTRSGSITITSNASNNPSIETLTGTGVVTTTILNGTIIQNGTVIAN